MSKQKRKLKTNNQTGEKNNPLTDEKNKTKKTTTTESAKIGRNTNKNTITSERVRVFFAAITRARSLPALAVPSRNHGSHWYRCSRLRRKNFIARQSRKRAGSCRGVIYLEVGVKKARKKRENVRKRFKGTKLLK